MTRYGYHAYCTHDATKNERRRCRTATRRALEGMPLAALRIIAREVSLEGRSRLNRAELIDTMQFDATVREVVANHTALRDALAERDVQVQYAVA